LTCNVSPRWRRRRRRRRLASSLLGQAPSAGSSDGILASTHSIYLLFE
jgi:hypothetical protein